MTDNFSKYNRKSVDDRSIDTLIGLSKGLLADGSLDGVEADFLLNWLRQTHQTCDHPIVVNLLLRVEAMLKDGVLDDEEQAELISLLRRLNGDESTPGELKKPSSLPLDSPVPEVIYANRSFLFTGTFVFGTRADCKSAVERFGGRNASGVSKSLDYLVIGSYVTDSWAHESFGRKIEKAASYRDAGAELSIIAEEDWLSRSGL